MGIYIKGMDMPTSCAACRIGHRETGWDNEDNEREIVFCPLINQGSLLEDSEAKKHRLCPLVPVQEHGRLIDADEMRDEWLISGENDYIYDTNSFLNSIDNAPTIIEAEWKNNGTA